MRAKGIGIWGAAALLVATTACQKQSPARPSDIQTEADGTAESVTDARTGVTMIAARPITPTENQLVGFGEQPLPLIVANARTAARSAITYTFEVASDEGFGNIVQTVADVEEGGGGRTSATVNGLLPETTYFWRVRADVGGVDGPYSRVRRFDVGPEVILQAPSLADPPNDGSASDRPTLRVVNAAFTGPAGPLTYTFEISEQSNFATLVYSGTQPQQEGTHTSHNVTQQLEEKTYWWRVRANDALNRVTGPNSNAQTFRAQRGIDLSQVRYVKGPNLSTTFERTATITEAYQLPRPQDQLCIYHTRLGLWPGTGFFGDPNVLVEGNQWAFRLVDGIWYGGAAHWYRPGQACKAVNSTAWKDLFYGANEEPLHSWVTQPGEVIGVLSSTPARQWPDMRTYDEMTNVQLIVFP